VTVVFRWPLCGESVDPDLEFVRGEIVSAGFSLGLITLSGCLAAVPPGKGRFENGIPEGLRRGNGKRTEYRQQNQKENPYEGYAERHHNFNI